MQVRMKQTRRSWNKPKVFGAPPSQWLPTTGLLDVLQLAMKWFEADAALIVAFDSEAERPLAAIGMSERQGAALGPDVRCEAELRASGTGESGSAGTAGGEAPLPASDVLPGTRLAAAPIDACCLATKGAIAVLLPEPAEWSPDKQRLLTSLACLVGEPGSASVCERMASSDALLKGLLASSLDAVVEMDLEGTITEWNPAAEAIYGFTRSEALGMSVNALAAAGQGRETDELLAAIRAGREMESRETIQRRCDGREFSVVISAFPIHDHGGKLVGGCKIIHDVTMLRQREREALRLMQLYAALSRVNRMLVDQPGREVLLQDACRALVEDAGLTLAWAGFLDPESGLIVPAAASGETTDYVDGLVIHAEDRPFGRGPTGRAFRSGMFEVRNDLASDPDIEPWKDRLAGRELRSSAAFPIRQEGRVCGVLSVYSKHVGYFGNREITLLKGVADSIGFGLDDSDRSEARTRAEAAVAEEQRLTTAIFDSMPGMLVVYDRLGRFLRWNRDFERTTGYSAAELGSMTRLDLVPEPERPAFHEKMERLLSVGGEDAFEGRIRLKSGELRPFFLTGRRVDLDEGGCIIGVGIDSSARIKAQEAMQAAEQRYRRLFASSIAGIAILAPDGRIQAVNPSLCKTFAETEEAMTGARFIDSFAAADADAIERLFARARAGEPGSGEWPLRRVVNGKVDLRLSATSIGNDEVMVVVRDVTEHNAQQRKIARLERIRSMIGGIHSVMLRRTDRIPLLLEACRVAVYDGGFVFALAVDLDPVAGTPNMLAAEGKLEGGGRMIESLLQSTESPDAFSWSLLREGRPIIVNSMRSAAASERARGRLNEIGIRSGAAFPLRVDGQTNCVLILMSPEPHAFDDDEIELLTWMVDDLSYALEHLHTARRLERLTNFDPLTGLMNAGAFRKRLADLSVVAGERRWRISIGVIDLKGFSELNRQMGYAMGDHLLSAVADRLRTAMGEDSLVGRSGGDKFAVARLAATEAELDAFEDMVLAVFAQPFDVAGQSIALDAELGVARYPAQGGRYDIPIGLDHADAAVLLAKESGKRSVLYSSAATALRSRRTAMEAELRSALDHDEFTLVYQPKVDVVKGKMVGAEALLRWQHPERGLLSPAEFIEVAERSWLIVPIGAWVIRQVCAQQAAWRAQGLPIQPVAANVSAAQLGRGDLLGVVVEALRENALEPKWLELEITESAVMQDVAAATTTLRALRDFGISLALDDFGTGYSSLSQLKRLPFSRVKIDRSFVTEVTTSVEDAAIAQAIIGIARSLGLTSVAEGVETAAQLNYLVQHQCDEIQGFYFSPPVDADKYAGYLRQDHKLALVRAQDDAQRRILVVDDEPSICKSLSRLLREEGYNVLIAHSGEQALESLAMQRVHVIISDQRMPGMSGTELLDKVKSLYPDVVRIILSGYTDIHVITDAVNRGSVFRFLTKPWDDDELLAVVRGAFVAARQAGAGESS